MTFIFLLGLFSLVIDGFGRLDPARCFVGALGLHNLRYHSIIITIAVSNALLHILQDDHVILKLSHDGHGAHTVQAETDNGALLYVDQGWHVICRIQESGVHPCTLPLLEGCRLLGPSTSDKVHILYTCIKASGAPDTVHVLITVPDKDPPPPTWRDLRAKPSGGFPRSNLA